MASLYAIRYRSPASRFAGRPVVDMTGLTKAYDFNLQFSPDDFRIMRIRAALSAGVELQPQALRLVENASDSPLFEAVQTLGLKLESRRVPVDTPVVDQALKAPIEK